jgi:hypothetical protein
LFASSTPDDKKRKMFVDGSSQVKIHGPAIIQACKHLFLNKTNLSQNKKQIKTRTNQHKKTDSNSAHTQCK